MLNQNNKSSFSPKRVFRALAHAGLAVFTTLAPVQFNSIEDGISISWSEAQADTIYLRDGTTLNGTITNQTRENVHIKLYTGADQDINKDKIRRIQYGTDNQAAEAEKNRLKQEEEYKKLLEIQKKQAEQKKLDEQKKADAAKAEQDRLAEIKRQNQSQTKVDPSFNRPAWKNAVWSFLPLSGIFDQLGIPRAAAYSMGAVDAGLFLRFLNMAGSRVKDSNYAALNSIVVCQIGSCGELVTLDVLTKNAKLNTVAQFAILASRSGSNSGSGSNNGPSNGPTNPLELLTLNKSYHIRTLFGQKIHDDSPSIFEFMPASARLEQERDYKNRLTKRYLTEYAGAKVVMGATVYLINTRFFTKSTGQANSDSSTYFYATFNPGFGGERSGNFAFVTTFN